MSTKVSISDLVEVVIDGLNDYADLASDELKKAVRKSASLVKSEIEQNAPRRTGDYAKSWAVKKQSETAQSISLVVYSKNRYFLAHLLERGHAKRNGGRVRAYPHIAPAKEAGEKLLEEELEKRLKND